MQASFRSRRASAAPCQAIWRRCKAVRDDANVRRMRTRNTAKWEKYRRAPRAGAPGLRQSKQPEFCLPPADILARISGNRRRSSKWPPPPCLLPSPVWDSLPEELHSINVQDQIAHRTHPRLRAIIQVFIRKRSDQPKRHSVNHLEISALSQERLFVHFDLLKKSGTDFSLSSPGQDRLKSVPHSDSNGAQSTPPE